MALPAGTAFIPVKPMIDKAGFGKVAKSMAVVAAGALAVGGGLVAVGKKFHEMRSAIIVGTGASGKALKDLENSAKAVGKQTPEDFKKVGEAIAEMNTATGATGKPLEGMTKAVLNASRILGEDGVANSKAFGRSLNQWGIPAKDGAKTADMLFAATQKYGIGLNSTTKQLSKYGTTLQAAGLDMQESVELFGRLQKGGLDLRRTMPGISLAMNEWAEAGKNPREELTKLVDRMKNAGSSSEAMKVAMDAGITSGTENLAQAVRTGGLSLKGLGKDLEDSRGAIDDADKRTRTFAESWKILKNKAMAGVEPIATKVFDALNRGGAWLEKNGVPTVKRLVGVLKDELGPTFLDIGDFLKGTVLPALKDLGSFIADTVAPAALSIVQTLIRWQNVLIPVAAGVLAIVVALKVYATVMAIVRAATAAWVAIQAALNVVLAANPIGLVVLALIGIAAALVVAYKKSETFRNIVDKAFAVVKSGAVAVADFFTKQIPKAFEKVVSSAGSVIGWVKSNWPLLLAIITGPIGLAVLAIAKNWDKIKAGARAVKDFVTGRFREIGDAIASLPGKIRALGGKMAEAGRSIMGRLFDGLRAVGDIGASIGRNLWNGIRGGINAAIQGVNDFLPNKVAIKGLPDIDLPDNPIPKIPAFRHGVRNFHGGLAYVHKDELLNLPRGTDVHTAAQTRQLLAGARRPESALSPGHVDAVTGGANSGRGPMIGQVHHHFPTADPAAAGASANLTVSHLEAVGV